MAPKAAGKARARSASARPPAAAAGARSRARAKASAASASAATSGGGAGAPASPEAQAAGAVRAAARRFLAAGRLHGLRAERTRHEADVAAAVRAAESAVLRQERSRAEAAQRKDQAKREKAQKAREDAQRLLGAAYDGDAARVAELLGAGVPVDACDVKGTTGVSEAASGGCVAAVRLLLDRRGNPNGRGEFARTPLWRAAYAGHAEVAQLLLEHGGDPRLYDEHGCAPADVASSGDVLDKLRAWDVARTNALVEEFEAWLEDQRLEGEFRRKDATRSLDAEHERARATHEAAQGALARARVELRDRVREHGEALAAGQQHAGWRQAQQACESATERAARAEGDAAAAQACLDAVLAKRLDAAEAAGEVRGAAGLHGVPWREVPVCCLNDVLLRDVGGRIAGSDRWPLLIDPSDCGKKFLAYAGCSVLNFWRHEDMDAGHVRTALLAMIRGGGVLAVDLCCFAGGVSRDLLAEPFDQVRAGLFDDLASRALLATPKGEHWPLFRRLVRGEEAASFGLEHFDDGRTARFKFVVVTSTDSPHQDLVQGFEVLRVVPGGFGE